MREIDRVTTELYGIPSLVLMENAAAATARVIASATREIANSSVLVLCGRGNNGGDGAAPGFHGAFAFAMLEPGEERLEVRGDEFAVRVFDLAERVAESFGFGRSFGGDGNLGGRIRWRPPHPNTD